MPEKQIIIIGTRGSKLSLAQTQLVADALTRKNPEIQIQIRVITTKGDVNQAPIPLDTVGKDWFTAEIEEALLRGDIDFAVHSLKDLSPQDSDHLTIVPVLKRADPRDVLISKSGAALASLPHGAIIGTDSVRRKLLLLEKRPDCDVRSIRGNVETRIAKLHAEHYDAIVLAAAGLERLGMLDSVAEFLDPTTFIPAIGQGTLAAQAKAGRHGLLEILKDIADAETEMAAQAEQSFAKMIGGGCKTPVGCYAHVENSTIAIHAMTSDVQDGRIVRKSTNGNAGDAMDLAETLANELLDELGSPSK